MNKKNRFTTEVAQEGRGTLRSTRALTSFCAFAQVGQVEMVSVQRLPYIRP